MCQREGPFNSLTFLVNLAATDLIKGIHLHCEAVYTWHRRQGLKIWNVRCKAGFKGNIVKVAVADIRLLSVLCDTLFTIITQLSEILNSDWSITASCFLLFVMNLCHICTANYLTGLQCYHYCNTDDVFVLVNHLKGLVHF